MEDPTYEEIETETPSGGVKMLVSYMDEEGEPAPRSKATRGIIVEVDADGHTIQETHMSFEPLDGSDPAAER